MLHIGDQFRMGPRFRGGIAGLDGQHQPHRIRPGICNARTAVDA